MENQLNSNNINLKFCKYCGEKIPMDAVICTKCGRQVEELRGSVSQQPIIINNSNNMSSRGIPKNKVTALLLCIFLGWIGAHKFYEGKIIMGILYLFTLGFFGIGIVIDLIILLFKPSTYYV